VTKVASLRAGQYWTYVGSAASGLLFSLADRVHQAGYSVTAAWPPVEILRIPKLIRLTRERGFQAFDGLERARSAPQPS